MPDDFRFDVFLSHSSKDKPEVRDIAERLKKDGVRVWIDEWGMKEVDFLSSRERTRVRTEKVEKELERSRVLILCILANAFGSDWGHLEPGTFGFMIL